MGFDERVFLSLSGLWLAEYFGSVEDTGRRGLDSELVLRLLGSAQLSPIHGLYLIFWGVRLRLPGIAGHAIGLLARPDTPGEVQNTVLMLLRQVPDLRSDQVDAIGELAFRCPLAVAAVRIADLRRAVAASASAAPKASLSPAPIVVRKKSKLSKTAGSSAPCYNIGDACFRQ